MGREYGGKFALLAKAKIAFKIFKFPGKILWQKIVASVTWSHFQNSVQTVN